MLFPVPEAAPTHTALSQRCWPWRGAEAVSSAAALGHFPFWSWHESCHSREGETPGQSSHGELQHSILLTTLHISQSLLPSARETQWEMPFATAPATAEGYQRLFSDEHRMPINLCVDLLLQSWVVFIYPARFSAITCQTFGEPQGGWCGWSRKAAPLQYTP